MEKVNVMEQQRRSPSGTEQNATKSSTRNRIVDAAAALFRAKGYASVSLREIAGAAGVTTGSLYHHFESKDDAVLAVMNGAHGLILKEVTSAVGFLGHKAPMRRKLDAAIHAHVDSLFGENSLPAATIRIFYQVPKEVRNATLPARHAYERYWISLLEEGCREGLLGADRDLVLLVPLIFGSMNWLLEWFDPERHDLDAVKAEIAKLIVSERQSA